MHSTLISIPRSPRRLTLTDIHSQFSCFAYSTKLIIPHNFSFESATSAVTSANNGWFVSNLLPFTLSQQSSTCLSHLTIHIYITQPCRHHKPCLNPTPETTYLYKVLDPALITTGLWHQSEKHCSMFIIDYKNHSLNSNEKSKWKTKFYH